MLEPRHNNTSQLPTPHDENTIVSQQNQEEPIMDSSTEHNDSESLDTSVMEEPKNATETTTYTHSSHCIKPTTCMVESTQ